jgi:hypothetical protein
MQVILMPKQQMRVTLLPSRRPADGRGCGTRWLARMSRFTRWFDHKYGEVREQHDWVKCHLMCGVKTNIVIARSRFRDATRVTPNSCPLLDATTKNFRIAEVSADKGYASRTNTNAVAILGATPCISFADHHKGHGGSMWGHIYHYFMFNRENFLAHYHKRSNVESTFSMMKRKFGDSLRSKTDVAMVNETLCKVLCHNLVVLIHEMYELGIDPVFWGRQIDSGKLSHSLL